MLVDENEAKQWYEQHGVSNEEWRSYDNMTKNLLRLEATLDEWEEVDYMRETGIPESAVLAFIKPDDIGIEHTKLQHLSSDESVTDVSTYVMQNSSKNITRLFLSSSTNVLSVKYTGDHIRLEIEATV